MRSPGGRNRREAAHPALGLTSAITRWVVLHQRPWSGKAEEQPGLCNRSKKVGVSSETLPQAPTATEKENFVTLDVIRNGYVTH